MCCSVDTTNSDQRDTKKEYFRSKFLKKFKVLETPAVLAEGRAIDPKNSVLTDPTTPDSLFTQSSTLICYGMLPDTVSFYSLIFYAPASTYVPVVSTFDKNGDRIDSKSIEFGCWDGGPDEYFCEGEVVIDNAMNLSLSHTILCSNCGNLSTNPIKYFNYGNGVFNSSGQIELNAQIPCDSIYTITDQIPQFQKSNADLYKYIGENLVVNSECRAEGGIVMQFDCVIDKKGNVVSFEILNLDSACAKEVLKALNGFPKWQPAKLNGEPTCARVRLRMDIKFG